MQTKFISLLPAQTIAKQAKQAKILIFLPQHNINLICSDFIWFKFTCFHYSKGAYQAKQLKNMGRS